MEGPSIAGARREPERIAVVDDDAMWRYLLSSALVERGFDVLEFASAEDFLSAAKPCEVDLVVVDAVMPKVDGFALCRRIRLRSDGGLIPLLMLTSLDDDGSITRAYQSGATDFFIKSTHWTLLVERLRRLIDDARRLSRALAGSEPAAADANGRDGLTGLKGRSAFLASVSGRIAAGASPDAPFTVVKLDVDRFDQVNAMLGQSAGDALLVQIAGRLRALDVQCVARLPGDEFALLLDGDRDESEVRMRLDQVVGVFREPFQIAAIEHFASASIGVASYPGDARDAGLLLSCARSAVARAKEGGRNRLAHFVRRRDDGARRIVLQNALHRALERDELSLHFQPVVDQRNGSVGSVEALMRWRHEGEWISPADFIPIAEDTGLIQALGEWAIVQALRQLREWRAEGISIGAVAVNVPAVHMGDPALVGVVRRALEEVGLAGDALVLELTESGAMRDVEVTLAQLERFRALGVRLAIDDFGTGHSSLARLTRLPIDTLKIDRSFVSRMNETREDGQVVRAIIALAASLGMDVVAEGVETAAQWQALRELGCQRMQGYLFSRPVPRDLAARMIRSVRQVFEDLDRGACEMPDATAAAVRPMLAAGA